MLLLTWPCKDFIFIVNLVKVDTVDNLVQKLRDGNAIEKQTVIAESMRYLVVCTCAKTDIGLSD
jgi:hypothetical protein